MSKYIAAPKRPFNVADILIEGDPLALREVCSDAARDLRLVVIFQPIDVIDTDGIRSGALITVMNEGRGPTPYQTVDKAARLLGERLGERCSQVGFVVVHGNRNTTPYVRIVTEPADGGEG